MKKIFYILASAIVALGAVACENDGLDNIGLEVNGDTVSFVASIDNNRTDLNGLETVWDTDDVIVVKCGENEYTFSNKETGDKNKFSCTAVGVTEILTAETITATYSHNGDGNIDSTVGTAGALLSYEGSFEDLAKRNKGFQVQNAFLKFTAAEGVVLTATEGLLSEGTTFEVTAENAGEIYVAINPMENATVSYTVNGEEGKSKTATFETKKIYNLGELNAPVIKDGAYFVVANNGTNWYLMNGGDTSTKYRAVTMSTASTTYSDDYTTYTNATADNVWNIEKVDGEDAYTFANNSKTLWLSTVTDATTGNNNAYVSDKAEDAEKLILTKNENGSFEVKSTTNSARILAFNKTSGQERFAFYMGTQVMDLYLVPVTGKIKSNVTMTFDPEVVSLTVGDDSFTAPTLSFSDGQTYDVTYSVENTEGEVASVSGNVVLVNTAAAGSATVTATFAGNETLNPAAASYTITVKAAGAVAEPVTVEMSAFTAISANMDTVVSYSSAQGGGTSAPAINSNQIRLYQNAAGKGGGTITITAKEGYTLSSVTIGSGMATSIAHTIGSSTTKSSNSDLAKNGKHTVSDINDSSITFHCMGTTSTTRLYVNYLSVTYVEEGSVDPTPDPDEPETPAEPVKLSAPTGLQADASDNTIEVRWTAVTNASGYTVTCGTDSKDVTETTATFTGLDYETEYPIKVVAKGDGINYTDSDAVTTTATTEEDPNAGGGEETTTWTRVTNVNTLLAGGTFIIGYEASANSGVIVPLRSGEAGAKTTANGYFYSGTTSGSSTSSTINMTSVSDTSAYEVTISASTTVSGAINIRMSTGNYFGNNNTKNTGRLYASPSANTAYVPTFGTNNVVTLKCNAATSYHTLQYNTSSPRFANYNGGQKNVVIYKKN